jgi:hypothetical protein
MNIRPALGLALCALGLAPLSNAASIYVMSSGNDVHDTTIVSAITALGNSAIIGVEFWEFDGTVPLTGYDAVVLQSNYNWTAGDMPVAGQDQLVAYVNGGGGLMTSEWTLWLTAVGRFVNLKAVFPSTETTSYNGDTLHTFQQVDADPTINSGLPATFDVDGDNVAGGETNTPSVKSGAKVFYATTRQGNFVGLSGWDVGQGRVAQFSQTVSERFVAHPFGFRLLGNVVEWVSRDAGTIQINPTSVTVRLGRIDSGTVAHISDIDGQVFRVCKFIVPNNQVAPVNVEVDGTSPIAVPSALSFRTYGRMNTTGLFTQTLDLYDWSISNFSTTAVTTSNIANTFRAAGVGADAPVSRFVDGANRVRARYRIRQTGPAASAAWCFEIDQAIWLVRP